MVFISFHFKFIALFPELPISINATPLKSLLGKYKREKEKNLRGENYGRTHRWDQKFVYCMGRLLVFHGPINRLFPRCVVDRISDYDRRPCGRLHNINLCAEKQHYATGTLD